MLCEPGWKIRERREELRDDDLRAVDVEDFEHLRRSGRIDRPDAGEQALAIGCRAHVEIVHHHHAPKRDFLRDLATRTVLGKTLQDAVLRREFSACH
jgi:hypothetical protein